MWMSDGIAVMSDGIAVWVCDGITVWVSDGISVWVSDGIAVWVSDGIAVWVCCSMHDVGFMLFTDGWMYTSPCSATFQSNCYAVLVRHPVVVEDRPHHKPDTKWTGFPTPDCDENRKPPIKKSLAIVKTSRLNALHQIYHIIVIRKLIH